MEMIMDIVAEAEWRKRKKIEDGLKEAKQKTMEKAVKGRGQKWLE
jgi:hypothetical protein